MSTGKTALMVVRNTFERLNLVADIFGNMHHLAYYLKLMLLMLRDIQFVIDWVVTYQAPAAEGVLVPLYK